MNKLQAGAAKKLISGPQSMLPFPDKVIRGNSMYTSVRKEIYVRAIAIDNGKKKLLYLIQELGAPLNTGMIKKRITEKFSVQPEYIFIGATHNHSTAAPVDISAESGWRAPIPPLRFRYSEYVVGQTVAAAGEAFASLHPARFGYGKESN